MRKFIALFLVFSLLALLGNLFAKERRGAQLVIEQMDGQLVGGELIAVKNSSLLLLSEVGTDVSVGIKNVKVIKIVRKSKAKLAAGIGLLAGGAFGALIGNLITDEEDMIFHDRGASVPRPRCTLPHNHSMVQA